MTSGPLGDSLKTGIVLVEFKYGAAGSPTYARYTNWSNDVAYNSNTYKSEPTMEFVPSPNVGGFDETPATITLKLRSGQFTDMASRGEPFSPIFVTVRELIKNPVSGAQTVLSAFKGRVSLATRNASGKANIAQFKCTSVKASLTVPLGIGCNNQCVWTLGSRPCGIDLMSQTTTATIDQIIRMSIVVRDLSNTPPANFFVDGWVEVDGCQIGVRNMPNNFQLDLVRAPPAGWLGATVLMVPGCNKNLQSGCRDKWNNEEHFGGFGVAIPQYLPVTETA